MMVFMMVSEEYCLMVNSHYSLYDGKNDGYSLYGFHFPFGDLRELPSGVSTRAGR